MTWGTQQLGVYTPCPQPKKSRPPKSVPAWEKMFCWKVGNVPWRRLEETKENMYQYPKIAKWDDSAAETAFKKAKRRYWAETNGLCITRDMALPPPHMYIDDIDWNSSSNDIDGEVILDLESSLEPRSDDADGDNNIVEHEAVIIGIPFVGVSQSSGFGYGGEFEDEDDSEDRENM